MHTVLIPQLNETSVKTVLGLLLVLFLLGYSSIVALFPKKDDLDGIKRIALSFGLSIAVVLLLGLALNFTAFGIRLPLILVVIASVKGYELPEGNRFVVEIGLLR